MLAVSGLSKSFGSIAAVKNIDFSVDAGTVVGILGQNGAGKSTLIKMLAGILRPDHGDIRIKNISLAEKPCLAKNEVGYLPESVALYTQMTVCEYLQFFGEMRNLNSTKLRERLQQVTALCRLQDVLKQKIETLSKGFRQRVGLAQALIHNPAVLILDEPTEGLDPAQKQHLLTLLQTFRKGGKTIVFCSHSLSEITELCDTLIFLRRGFMTAIGPKSVFADDLHGLEKKFLELAT